MSEKKDYLLLDFNEIIQELYKAFPNKTVEDLVKILNYSKIDDRLFKYTFVATEKGFSKIFVKCPSCKGMKRFLYRREDGAYKCRECWNIKLKRDRSRRRVSSVYARYVRPLKKLALIEQQLFLDNLTPRKRSILEAKAARLRKAIPEYIHLMRNDIMKALGGNDIL